MPVTLIGHYAEPPPDPCNVCGAAPTKFTVALEFTFGDGDAHRAELPLCLACYGRYCDGETLEFRVSDPRHSSSR